MHFNWRSEVCSEASIRLVCIKFVKFLWWGMTSLNIVLNLTRLPTILIPGAVSWGENWSDKSFDGSALRQMLARPVHSRMQWPGKSHMPDYFVDGNPFKCTSIPLHDLHHWQHTCTYACCACIPSSQPVWGYVYIDITKVSCCSMDILCFVER